MVLEKERTPRSESLVTGHLLVMISIGVAVGILILIGVLLFVGIPSSGATEPTLAELGSVVGKEEAVQTYEQLRQERFESIKELLRLLVIALAVPMLALVLGYFSERQPKGERRRPRPEPQAESGSTRSLE